MQKYDLCVIGTGPAGQMAAIEAAKLGKRVCAIERMQTIGGVAINTGTIPSKALREAILRVTGKESVAPRYVDFQAARNAVLQDIQGSVHSVIRNEINIISQHFRRYGVETIFGTGEFADDNTLVVRGVNGDSQIAADRFVIAVGTVPAEPDTIEFDNSSIVTSDGILNLPTLPKSLIVVGGGVIGTEYASMFAALGVDVTLIEGQHRLLPFVDGEIVEALQYQLRRTGLTLRMGEKVVSIRKVAPTQAYHATDGSMVEAMLESGKTLRSDCLLYAIGRQGATEELKLDNVGLKTDKRGRLAVNENFQTDREHIYACGDVIGFPALASTSMEQGRFAACHMFGKCVEKADDLLPYGIYAVPEISMVGWTEEKLTEEGIPFESGKAMYSDIARGQLIGDDIGMLKILIHQESRTVLGVHVIGTGATELVHIGQVAIAFKATVDYFINTVFNYPTLAECYKVAARNALDKLRMN
ncbi:MAG: Si-specific NAD(P)(+) transhydrogenase [Phycisphaeraceae bacterium]|nr:Si-specific NAD(P)(+) transhydrogenase [Phycisphaerales bacterium]MCB9861546.1 Si-specific NAD(P)(+) transhydrogenase [Phycisphaeraceae bacterium]